MSGRLTWRWYGDAASANQDQQETDQTAVRVRCHLDQYFGMWIDPALGYNISHTPVLRSNEAKAVRKQ